MKFSWKSAKRRRWRSRNKFGDKLAYIGTKTWRQTSAREDGGKEEERKGSENGGRELREVGMPVSVPEWVRRGR